MGNNFSQDAVAMIASTGLLAIGYTFTNIKADDSVVSSLVSVAHVGSTGMWFGIQTWVSFVAGLAMLSTLPRPWFAKMNMVLFHKYFLGGLMLNSTMLATYLSRHPINTWQGPTMYRGATLVGAWAMIPLSIYLKPKFFAVVKERDEYECQHGQSEVIGMVTSKLLLSDPDYKVIMTKFHKWHAIFMLVSLAQYSLTGYNLYSIGNTIRF